MKNVDVLIVGGGHAGAQAAVALRQLGFSGTITVATDEPDFPYERPPLSKEYLAREKEFDRILIRKPTFWDEKQVEFITESKVVLVDPAAHSVALESGESLGYGSLIWAAGGTPRKLGCGGAELTGVYTVRTRADADQMLGHLPEVENVVIIGGGYIGLEAAAVMSKFGKQVTVIETQSRVLARVAGEALSRFYENEHRAHGVDIRLNTGVDELIGEQERVAGVKLTSGEVLPADMVIVGIGIIPEVAPLLMAGAEGGNGVKVDEFCKTSLNDIFAIGDCALHSSRFADGAEIRLESVQNANDMGTTAAKCIVGTPKAYEQVPWFWSNQYDVRLQTVGLSIGFDQTVLRGDPESRSFSIVYLKCGRVIALDCVNQTKDYVQGRKLIVEGVKPNIERLQDASVPLKELSS